MGRPAVKHRYSTVALGIALLSGAARAQAQSDELSCALFGAERAPACLRALAERSSRDGDIERATELLVRTGAVERAEAAIERAWSRGPTAPLWNAVFTVAHTHEARNAHAASLRWHRRWSDDAKRRASADVLAALLSGEGRAWLALGQHALAYDAWRLAVHVWRAEHGYKLDDDGAVLNEFEGERGYVAPARWTAQQVMDARRGLREGVDPFDVYECIEANQRDLTGLARCVRRLRPPPPDAPFAGLTDIAWISPFEGVRRASAARTSAHRTRSGLSADAFERGNRAAGEAWLGMLRITVEAIDAVTIPAFHTENDRAFDRWARTTVAPRMSALRVLMLYRAQPCALQAIATGVPEVELEAIPLLANTFATFGRRTREIPLPPSWRRSNTLVRESIDAEW
jgi:hypothetical protein